MRNYQLVCTSCAAIYEDDGVRLQCDRAHGPALLRTQYDQLTFMPGNDTSVLRYRCWLPDARELSTTARTGVYHSTALGSHLGLRRLWIAFSGWWPERGATLPTGSFKDLEAVSVLRRSAAADRRPLVISSAGNTARAFAQACSDHDIPALLVVPLRGWTQMLRAVPLGPSVRVIAIADAEYDDAIGFARDLCATGDYVLEGGVRNVARRDGMGTAMLAAAEAIGALPTWYFQAVGSAAGGLAAHEAALRLRADGRYGAHLPRLMLSQNAPFAPIHEAWQAQSDTLPARSAADAAAQLAQLDAFVLGNQAPPYAAAGGIREALVASDGDTDAITNAQLGNALAMFAELEGIGIEPAAGVAVAALVRAAARKALDPDDAVLLHVTGGGRRALPDRGAAAAQPTLVLARAELGGAAVDRARAIRTDS